MLMYMLFSTLLLLTFIRLQFFYFLSSLKTHHSQLYHETWRRQRANRKVSCVMIRVDGHQHSLSHELLLCTAPALTP